MRPTGGFDSVHTIANTAVAANGKTFRLGDIASVHRSFVNPPTFRMRFNGQLKHSVWRSP
ncbi:hypothetical protein [Paludibacterium denitrificans]|uniref:hypothetical protein n=1 Tax=Paludibacterium denitrificans TaxID=2675226 RepID=UPI00247825FE|nr:hypothetical protein [Paludibacterium denitrificans]